MKVKVFFYWEEGFLVVGRVEGDEGYESPLRGRYTGVDGVLIEARKLGMEVELVEV